MKMIGAKLQSSAVWEVVVHDVNAHARATNVSGVLVATSGRHDGLARFAFINCDSPLREGVKERDDLNYAAVAFWKAGTVVGRGCDTPPEPLFKGDCEWRGGCKFEDDLSFSFSGGTEDEDVWLAHIAAEAFARG